MTSTRRAVSVVLALAAVSFLPPAARAAELQDRLNAGWQGTWVVLQLETSSDCDDSFTNNRIAGSRAVASAPHRLPAGELGRIARVDVKRSRIDVLIDLAEPLRVSWTDGPYELFEQARCRVELELEVPRDLVKKKAQGEIEALLARLLERHDERASAARSERWNRRRVEPLPAGYDEVLEEYRAWKATRLRADLLDTLDEALEDAQRALDRAVDDPAYGAGLAAGTRKEASRYRSWDDCEELVDESFYPASKDAPAGFEGSDERAWERGYKDGQVLAFSVELARHIGECLEDL